MQDLTLIPETVCYRTAILVVYGLSAPALTSHVRASVRQLSPLSFLTTYAVTLVLICLWASSLFSVSDLFGTFTVSTILWYPAGVALGLVAVRADRAIVRRLNRGTSARAVAASSPVRYASEEPPPPAATLVAIAILEELIYRGFLVKVCFLLAGPVLIVFANLACLAFFALGHVRFGWVHVVAKTPLGMLALGITLLAGTVLPAMLLHAAFNMAAWKAVRARA
jgi:membrane protease YdiL (CAAX protease family)